MPTARAAAVSYLIQRGFPRSNILFIIEGDSDVQTLIVMPTAISFLIKPETRQMVRAHVY